MDLKVIQGGAPNKLSKEQAQQKLTVFLDHMRNIERNISVVVQMADTFEFPELSKRARENHRGLLDTLKYVKNRRKEIINAIQTKCKEPNLKLL
ncbi:hypothetical protein KAR91_88155 [Candidatus Pacearchaeota archaeon]|nr:hypothetical protein [Candidatus Pacearchaeota archaeon]